MVWDTNVVTPAPIKQGFAAFLDITIGHVPTIGLANRPVSDTRIGT